MMAAMMVEDEDGVRYVPGAYLLLEMAHGGDLFDKIGRLSTSKIMPRAIDFRLHSSERRR